MLRIGMSSGSTTPAASTSASIVIRGRTLPLCAAARTASVSSFPRSLFATTAEAPATRPASATPSSTKSVWITTARLGLRSSTSNVRLIACVCGSSSMTTTRWTSSTGSMYQGWRRTGLPTMGGNSQNRLGGLRIYEAAADGVAGQVHAVAQAQLLEDVRPVALDGLLAQHEQGGDLLRGVAFRDQLRDLFLARRQRVFAVGPAVVGVSEEVLDQRGHRARVEKRFAAHRGAAGLDEVLVSRRLEHVAGRTGLQRLVQVLLVVVHRQNQHLRLGSTAAQLASGLQPGHARHSHVEDRQVDIAVDQALERLRAVAGFVDDLQVGLGVQHHAQPAPDHRVVVGQEDARLQRYHRPSSSIGTSRRISVPAPSRRPNASAASTIEARSAMPCIPLPAVASGGSPWPASATVSDTRSGPVCSSRSSAVAEPEWRATFVSASWATR